MKRLLLTTTGTVAGLAALLSFKTQTHPLASSGPLPSAGTPDASTSTPAQAAPSSATGSSGTATKNVAATPRTVTGTSVTTRYGVVQVRATIVGTRITDVAFVQLQAFDGHSQQINSYAAPQLLQETLSKQTAQVDTISGASYTSAGYRQSLQSALDRAGFR